MTGAGGVIGERGPGWGVDWGTPGEIPSGALVAGSDSEAAGIVAEARRAGRGIPPVLLTGGDLARTLGVGGARRGSAGAPRGRANRRANPPHTGEAVARAAREHSEQERETPRTGSRVSVDVGAALIDGRLHWFVAHLVARRSWWRGRLLVAANASFLGRWNAAPRSHPGDGRLDVFDTDPSLAVRFAAWRRLPSGSHVPHPEITQRRTAAFQYEFNPALDVYLDGRLTGRCRTLSLRVEPGAMEVWIPDDS